MLGPSVLTPRERGLLTAGTVCGIQRTYPSDDESESFVRKVIPIAGDLVDRGGHEFEYEATRLKTSKEEPDREGLRLTLKGGAYPLEGSNKRNQKAVIEFLCDPELEGTEGEWSTEVEYEDGKEERSLAGDARLLGRGGVVGFEQGEEQLMKEGAALKFVSYGEEKGDDGYETLRLEWRTKYACEASYEEEKSGSWGFFTWFLIVYVPSYSPFLNGVPTVANANGSLFMITAAYLIFGSWLNYTRYGARGWDLVPHGDTIRDVPYLLKDWTRSVLNTVQGSGSRGGYSAV